MGQEKRVLRLERVAALTDGLVELQRIFDGAPDYVRLTTGAGPTGREARDLWDLIPAGVSRADKWVFVLRYGTKPVGCLDLLRDYPGPGTDFLGLLVIPESLRGRGLGRRAHETAEKLLRAWGTERLRLGVLEDNDAAAFWERMGFRRTGERTPYASDTREREVLLFEKTLAPDARVTEDRPRRRRRLRFVSDDLVDQIVRGTKTASICRLGEVDLIEDVFDDPLFVGEAYDVFDMNGARRTTVRVLGMELARWDDIPERLWRGEGNRSVDEFREDHVGYLEDPGPDTEFVAYYFTVVPAADASLDLELREYADSDWEAVCAIHDSARPVELGSLGPGVRWSTMADIAEEDRFFEGRTFVAESGGRVVGFVTAEGPELSWLYVDPDHVGRGVGRSLVELVVPLIGRDGFVLCVAGNLSARRFYDRCGFTPAAVFPGSVGDTPCGCVRLCLPWSRHRDRPPRPTDRSLELSGFSSEHRGGPVRCADGVWRWSAEVDGDGEQLNDRRAETPES
ncbi:MAG: GNAT family N-acetyltransferase [Candidatus Eisenbacteria bacterium]|nr:GNAT family N-acetyltransferase [Candidatus Eisenbacteria bacterium]